MALSRSDFFTNSIWICPAGVTTVILVGAGGGGGGGGSVRMRASTDPLSPFVQAMGGAGGGGAIQSVDVVIVVPGTTYTVSLGAGGAGGVGIDTTPGDAMLNAFGNNGSDGGNTLFSQSSTVLSLFSGAGGGCGGTFSNSANIGGGFCIGKMNPALNVQGNSPARGASLSLFLPLLSGIAGDAGYMNYVGNYTPGANGTSSGLYMGGAGGGVGPRGNGGAGGNADPTGIFNSTGSAAGNNTAAGGGGAGGAATLFQPVGGQGGQGFLRIIY